MSRVRTLFAGFMGALAFVASAHAADPAGSWRRPPLESDYEKPTPQFKELMSGWYLRADIGYRWNSGGPSNSNVTSERYTNSYDASVGFGLKYQWFRADVIYDRSGPTRVSAFTTVATNQPQFTAKIRSETVLVNGYVDFGTWGGFTPYVGGGAGVARLKSVNYVDTTDSPSNNVWGVTGPGKSQNFAWAAMAGVAYQISPSWMIDVGFRHLDLGDVVSSEGAGTRTNAIVFKGQTVNEVRIGLRYLLD
jgi:opacity protein-like surface antigen